MSNWMLRYFVAFAAPAAAVLSVSLGGAKPSLVMCLVAAAVGLAGVICLLVGQLVYNGRYTLANRAEAKRQKHRSATGETTSDT